MYRIFLIDVPDTPIWNP